MTLDEIHNALLGTQILCPEKRVRVNLRYCCGQKKCYCTAYETLHHAAYAVEQASRLLKAKENDVRVKMPAREQPIIPWHADPSQWGNQPPGVRSGMSIPDPDR